jgi:hypothetical protein
MGRSQWLLLRQQQRSRHCCCPVKPVLQPQHQDQQQQLR